jgi:hypothetical protein
MTMARKKRKAGFFWEFAFLGVLVFLLAGMHAEPEHLVGGQIPELVQIETGGGSSNPEAVQETPPAQLSTNATRALAAMVPGSRLSQALPSILCPTRRAW